MALKPHLHQWIPAPERRGYLALLLLEIEAGLRCLPHTPPSCQLCGPSCLRKILRACKPKLHG